MTQIGEGISLPPPDEAEGDNGEPRRPITVRCSLFFDGTLNNRTNVQHRHNNSDEYHATKPLWHRATGWGDGKGDGSYENDESNIAVMESFIDKAEGYDLSFSIYTEGPGTINHDGDKLMGSAFGIGSSGVESKVQKGINDAVSQIAKNRSPDEFIIKLLTIDVFGFSRGAAGARYCIHKVLHCNAWPMKDRLELWGFEVKTIEVCFAGLYDTVSSHGFNFYDVETLHLESIRFAKRAVHLVAADEYRKNFSLTNIKSALSKGGEEYVLPGAHSDIGGGYRDNVNESFVVFKGRQKDALKERERWIAEGWCTEDEIDMTLIRDPETYQPIGAQLKINRKGISNAYSAIPLKVMARFTRESAIAIKNKFDREIAEILNPHQLLLILEGRINEYVNQKPTDSGLEVWDSRDNIMRGTRNRYLHVSANFGVGMKARFKDGRMYREEYDG